MKNCLPALFAMLIAGAPAAAQPHSPAATTEPALRYQIASWGRTLSEWRIESDGSGLRRAARGSVFGNHVLTTSAFRVGPDQLAQLAAIIVRLQPLADANYSCRIAVTDGAYGALSWKRPAGTSTINFNSGCTEPRDRQNQGWIAEADRLVTGWAEAGKVIRTEPVKAGQSPPVMAGMAPAKSRADIAIDRFAAAYAECEHWAGEEPYDAARRREITRNVKATCTGLDRRLRLLRQTYRRDPAATARLTTFAFVHM